MVETLDALEGERFNQQLYYHNAQGDKYFTEPKPEALKDMPEKKTFLGSLLRRSSSSEKEEKKDKKSSTGLLPFDYIQNIFKKSTDGSSSSSPDLRQPRSTLNDEIICESPSGEGCGQDSNLCRTQDEVDSDVYINQLRLMEGRTDEEVAALVASVVQEPKIASPRSKKNSVASFFSSVHQALKEEFSLKREDFIYPPPSMVQQDFIDPRQFTVAISAAPFFAAPPPESDMSFEELARFEPVYLGSGCCINNLPVKKYDGTPLPGEQQTCPICIAPFEKNEDLKSLPCVHFYHKECIDRWLMVGHSCPCCKALVL